MALTSLPQFHKAEIQTSRMEGFCVNTCISRLCFPFILVTHCPAQSRILDQCLFFMSQCFHQCVSLTHKREALHVFTALCHVEAEALGKGGFCSLE